MGTALPKSALRPAWGPGGRRRRLVDSPAISRHMDNHHAEQQKRDEEADSERLTSELRSVYTEELAAMRHREEQEESRFLRAQTELFEEVAALRRSAVEAPSKDASLHRHHLSDRSLTSEGAVTDVAG